MVAARSDVNRGMTITFLLLVSGEAVGGGPLEWHLGAAALISSVDRQVSDEVSSRVKKAKPDRPNSRLAAEQTARIPCVYLPRNVLRLQ